jgi:hypothetical protein
MLADTGPLRWLQGQMAAREAELEEALLAADILY